MRTQYAYLATNQKARPSGIRVVEPPADTLQAARGKLYAVIEFADSTPEANQRVERALSAIQRTYYTIKGTQSSVLGEALREGLQEMITEDQPASNQADLGILLVTLVESRLMAVGTGAVVALFTNGGKVDVFPPGAIQFGETGEPIFDVYRQDAPAGTAFLLAGNYCLEYFSLRDLASTVAHLKAENLTDIVLALCEHADVEQLPGLFLVTSPDAAVADAKGKRMAEPPPTPRRRMGGLPAALQSPPPARPRVEAGEANQSSSDSGPAPDGLPAAYADMDSDDTADSVPVEIRRPAFNLAGVIQLAVQMGAQQTKAMVDKMLPERAAARSGEQVPLATPAAPSRSAYTAVTAPQPASTLDDNFDDDFADTIADEPDQPYTTPRTATPAKAGTTILDRIATFRPPIRATGSRARLYILLALLILILTPVVVTAVFWSRDMRNQEDAERTVDMAEASFLSAETALQNEDRETARIKLNEAQTFILAADNMMGGRMARADELSVRIERELADLLQVQPLYALAEPLVRFLAEAAPQRVLVNDQDIYVLDLGRQVVQYFQLDPTLNMVTNPEGETVLQQGQTVDTVAIGQLVDIAWQPPIAGVQDKAYLLLMDRNNNLFRYDRRVEGASRLAIGGQEQLRAPVRMRVYADRLYIADEGANQLFRYSGNYTQPPELWFNAQAQSDLGSLSAMDIDGDIWLLYTQGMVSRYRTGAQVPFSLENSVGTIAQPVDIAVGDQGNSMVYVADAAQERIIVYDKEGKYQRQFRAPEGHPLRDLKGLFVDEVEDTMYILTQTALFKHSLTQAN